MSDTQKPTKRASTGTKTTKVFTAEERAAIQERAREVKSSGRSGAKAGKVDDEAAALAKIAEMPAADRALAERIHAIVKAAAPSLAAKTWYGMPAYAKDGKLICFFTPAAKFKSRYATLGFDENANLDDGTMWATSWAITRLTAADEKRITELVKKAVS